MKHICFGTFIKVLLLCKDKTKDVKQHEFGQTLMSLKWNRNDDVKSSKIYCQLDNVSIKNEVDWLQMARFHAEWSKKFYDVIVPYLIG